MNIFCRMASGVIEEGVESANIGGWIGHAGRDAAKIGGWIGHAGWDAAKIGGWNLKGGRPDGIRDNKRKFFNSSG